MFSLIWPRPSLPPAEPVNCCCIPAVPYSGASCSHSMLTPFAKGHRLSMRLRSE